MLEFYVWVVKEMDHGLLLQCLFIIFLGTVGIILFKYGVNVVVKNLGRPLVFKDLANINFLINFLFSPIIFTALATLFFSRISWALPLSDLGIGRFTAILTSLNVVITVAVGVILFKETFTLREGVGVILAVLAVYFLSS